jgi:hypothetical protein
MNDIHVYMFMVLVTACIIVITYLLYKSFKDAKRTVPNGIISISLAGISAASGSSIAASSHQYSEIVIVVLTVVGLAGLMLGVKFFGHTEDDFAGFIRQKVHRERFFGLLRYVCDNYVDGEDASKVASGFGVTEDVVIDAATFLAELQEEEEFED